MRKIVKHTLRAVTRVHARTAHTPIRTRVMCKYSTAEPYRFCACVCECAVSIAAAAAAANHVDATLETRNRTARTAPKGEECVAPAPARYDRARIFPETF